jgi:hypothetical protein
MQIQRVSVFPVAPLLAFQVETVLSAQEVIERIKAFIVPEPFLITYRRELRGHFLGKISGMRFRMRHHLKKPGVPIILGRVTPVDHGSIVQIIFFVPEFLFVLLAVLGAIACALFADPPEVAIVPSIMGLTLLVPTVVNFQSEVRRALMALRHVAHAGSAPTPTSPSATG